MNREQKTDRVVCRNIKRLREKIGMAPADLAAKSDADRTHVAHWEAGDYGPNQHRLRLVAKALGVSVEALLYDPECQPRRPAAHRKAAKKARPS